MTRRPAPVDVVVDVGGWEHECCGAAVERNDLMAITCLPFRGTDGQQRLAMTNHGGIDRTGAVDLRGRVVDLEVVRDDGSVEQVLRVPSGRALRGFDPDDDGHLETPWTEERLPDGREFRVTLRTATVRS